MHFLPANTPPSLTNKISAKQQQNVFQNCYYFELEENVKGLYLTLLPDSYRDRNDIMICWWIFNSCPEAGERSIALICDICWFLRYRNPTMAGFRLPMWCHWTFSWEEMHITSWLIHTAELKPQLSNVQNFIAYIFFQPVFLILTSILFCCCFNWPFWCIIYIQ